MSSPCNSLNVTPIKVSKLVRYKNIDTNDFILTIESGSALYSRKSTFGDLIGFFRNVTGSYSGSFSGSYYGKVTSKNIKASGSLSGSYFGNVTSKNTKASGSFSGSYWGNIISKNTKASGSFNGNLSGSYFGNVTSKNTKASGSFSGSYWGNITSKNTKATGSFSGTNSKLTGSFSGSHWGSLISKNAKASGSFSGSFGGKLTGKNSLITGSFRGIDNITNFNGTGKKVSFNGTASYAISASYVGGPARMFSVFTRPAQTTGTPPTPITLTITKPTGATWYDFEIFLSSNARTDNGMQLQGYINFNTAPLVGTSLSEQYDAGTMPNTGMGNITQTWEGTVDNDSCLCRWEHTGMIPSSISSTNTISFVCGVTILGGSYDGSGYQVAGIKASYYF